MVIKEKVNIESITWKVWSWYMLSIPFLFFFTSLWLQFMPYGSNVEGDMPFYSKISLHLFKTGIENTQHYFNEGLNYQTGNSAYHYLELWFNGLISKLLSSHYTNMFTLRFFTIPYFIVLIVIGLKNFITNNRSLSLFIASLLFIIFVSFINYSSIVNFGKPAWGISNHFFTRSNFIFFYFALISAFYILFKHHNTAAFAGYLLLAPIISITTAPAIFTGIVLFTLFKLILKSISKHEAFKILGYTIATAIAIYLFYMITGTKVQSRIVDESGLVGLISYNLTIWKAIVHQIVTLSIRILLFAVIPFALTYKFRDKIPSGYFNLLLFSIITAISGIVLFQTIPTIDNAYQIPYIGYTSIGIVLIISILILFEKLNNYWKVGLFCLFGISLFLIKKNQILPLQLNKSIEYNYLIHQGFNKQQIQLIDKKISTSNRIIKAGFIRAEMDKPIVYQTGNLSFILSDKLRLYPITPLSHFKEDNKDDIFNNLSQQFPFYTNFDTTSEIEYINQYIEENDLQFVFSDAPIEGLNLEVIVLE
ncbi:hypothetical protein QA597_08065 [Marinilabiliaceae bacterium ANBcel2]|nr:hypothetical protein [Marinilabiliaceae bacterium ANBcel2]